MHNNIIGDIILYNIHRILASKLEAILAQSLEPGLVQNSNWDILILKEKQSLVSKYFSIHPPRVHVWPSGFTNFNYFKDDAN